MAMLDMLESYLQLNDSEKATLAPALPIVANWLAMLEQQWGTLGDAVAWLSRSKPVADRFIADGKQLAPIAHDVLSGGGSIFESGGAMGAYNDLKSVINANPQLIGALQHDYAALAPLIVQVEGDLKKPELQKAIAVLESKLGQHNISRMDLLGAVMAHAVKPRAGHAGRGGLGVDAQVIKKQ